MKIRASRRSTAVAAAATLASTGSAYVGARTFLSGQAEQARRVIPKAWDTPPRADGVYTPGGGPVERCHRGVPFDLHLMVFGDSTATGYGARNAEEVPGVMIARNLAEISGRLVLFASAQTNRIDRVSQNVATTSDAFAGVAKTFQGAVARLDTATSDNQLKDILNNGRQSSADLRQAAADMRSVMAAARANEASLVRVLQQADSLMTKIQRGNGTLGMLATDSTLYRETTATVIQFRELLTDIQAHPKKYLKISVF